MLSCTQTCPDLNGIVGGVHHFARHHLRPHHSLTRQMSLFKIVCFGWGILCMLVCCCQGKRYASRNRLQECGVQDSGDTLRNRGRVAVIGLQHKHTGREEPWAWIIQPLSVIIAAHCCFCRSAVLLIAMQHHACAVTPHEYCKTFCLLHHMNTRTLYACYTVWKKERLGGRVSIFLPVSMLTLVRFWGVRLRVHW